MAHEFKDGRCVVMKKEMENCLVLPKGTLSLSRDMFLSKEGFEKLKEYVDKDKMKSGVCNINREKYDDCYIIPPNVLTIKVPALISHAAISGIGAAMAKLPSNEEKPKKKAKAKPETKKEPQLVPATQQELDDAVMDREIAEENLKEAEKALSEADEIQAINAQKNYDEAKTLLDEKSRIEKEIAKRVHFDVSEGNEK